MSQNPILPAALACTLCAFIAGPAAAQELLRDELASDAGWGTNASSADINAAFGYDYSDDGIPEAPNSRSGDAATTGLKLEANIVDPAAVAFVTLYPTGQNFSGKYRLRFDAWMNYDVDEVVNGASQGTTEFLGGGVGYDNVTADVASGAQVIATGEGGSGSDWRAFKSPPQFFVDAANMAAGSRNGADPYYANFLPGVAPPAAQGQPAIDGIAGSPGFQWVTFEFSVLDHLVDVVIEKPNGDRLNIVQLDCNDTSDGSSGCTTAGNISLFYGDFFTSVSPRPDLTFGVIDNVVVTVIPEPASFLLVGVGCAVRMLVRRRR